MDLTQLLILAAVQGVTEFLPISSAAHLILVPHLTGWRDQGLLLDVAMHIGTLAAVMLYFRVEVARLLHGAWQLVRGRFGDDTRLLLLLVVATLPVVVAGLALKDYIAHDWRNPLLIAGTTIGFGLVLFAADRTARLERGLSGMTWTDALLIGLAQALALVPGVSRSGITMTAGLFLAFGRAEAARFSLLLSIPTTFAAGMLAGLDLYRGGDATLQSEAFLAAVLAFAAALAAIAGLMAWLRRATFTPFVVYRLLLGAVILAWYFAPVA